ncbi:MAG TPA: rhodanese-like domain-containing protein [Roseimicrobium sp.]|nr:rhodanese-like domain-containing protein [Roseimicrobium sp.]
MNFKQSVLLALSLAIVPAFISNVPAAEKASDSKAPAVVVHHVAPDAAAALIQEKKVVVLDVRTGDEFVDGHIAGAKNLDFLDGGFKAQLATLDKKQPYLIHCASGGRSTRSLDVFKEAGFTNLYHLDGGIKAWEKAGKPVVK